MTILTDPFVWVVRLNDRLAGDARHMQFCQHFGWTTRPMLATRQEVADLPPCKDCMKHLSKHHGETTRDAIKRVATWWYQAAQQRGET